MKDQDKSKKQLINELVEQQNAQMQSIEKHLEQVKNSLQKSEERYYTVFNNSIDAILLTEPNGGVYAANPEACRVFGWTEDELCGIGRNGVVDITDIRLQTALDERLRTGKFKGELTYIRKDGSKFPGEVSTAIFEDIDGSYKTSMIIRDITDRKKIEEELKKTSNLMKLFIQKTDRKQYIDALLVLLQEWINCRCIGIKLFKKDGYIPHETYVGYTDKFCMTEDGSFSCNNLINFITEMSVGHQSRFNSKCVESGFKSVAILPIRFFDRVLGVIHLADEKEERLSSESVEFVEKVSPLIGEAVYRFNLEDELRQKNDNLEQLINERTKELNLANEKLQRDVIVQKRLKDKLKRVNQQVTDILNSITDSFLTLDHEWRFTYLNKKAAQIYSEQLIGKNIWDCFPKLVNTELYKEYHRAIKDKVDVHLEIMGAYSKTTWYEVHIYPSQEGISVYFHDITKRKKIEEKLRLSEERFSKAFNLSPAAMSIYSIDRGKFIDANEHCLKMHGYRRDELS
jgi:PAS domain S-box